MKNGMTEQSVPSISVAAVFALRDACEDLLAHARIDSDEWHPRGDLQASADDALQRDALAFAIAIKRVIDEAS